jgi:thiol:disulfide interchange protein
MEIVKDFFGMLLLYSAFLVSMQLRKYANDVGGRLLVGVITVVIGIVTGLFFAARAKADGQQ